MSPYTLKLFRRLPFFLFPVFCAGGLGPKSTACYLLRFNLAAYGREKRHVIT